MAPNVLSVSFNDTEQLKQVKRDYDEKFPGGQFPLRVSIEFFNDIETAMRNKDMEQMLDFHYESAVIDPETSLLHVKQFECVHSFWAAQESLELDYNLNLVE